MSVPPERRRAGMVFQDVTLFPHLNVFENIAFGLNENRLEKERKVLEMLELVNLQGYEKKMPHEISGGEQQRIAIARALAPSPELLLLDEPFSSLDYQLRVQLREDVREILREQQVSSILVTHDQAEAFTFAEHMVIMNNGEITQTGTPVQIYH